MSIGAMIRKYRKEKGVTIAELATKISISQPYLSQIERGNKKCPIDLLEKISEVLEVDIAYFFDDLTNSLKEWISIGRLLTDDERQCLISFLKIVKNA